MRNEISRYKGSYQISINNRITHGKQCCTFQAITIIELDIELITINYDSNVQRIEGNPIDLIVFSTNDNTVHDISITIHVFPFHDHLERYTIKKRVSFTLIPV